MWNPGIPGDTDPARPATVWRPSRNPYSGYSVDPALGNGSADATAAINDAIAAAGRAATAGARKVVLLAPGTYRTSGAISIGSSNVTLRGAGQGRKLERVVVFRGARAGPSRSPTPSARAAGSSRTSVSIITLPT